MPFTQTCIFINKNDRFDKSGILIDESILNRFP